MRVGQKFGCVEIAGYILTLIGLRVNTYSGSLSFSRVEQTNTGHDCTNVRIVA